LVYCEKDNDLRCSGEFEKVGTSYWMPPWHVDIRVDEVKQDFDLYSLGKLLWCLITGKKRMPTDDFRSDSYSLEKLFPQADYIHFANNIFENCIVTEPTNCKYKNASELLSEIDEMIGIITKGTDILYNRTAMSCRVCGRGKYNLFQQNKQPFIHIHSSANGRLKEETKLFICNYCGNVQWFLVEGSLPAWK